jgi:hypothetical protein
MAKTQKSLSENQTKVGRPRNFNVTVREFSSLPVPVSSRPSSAISCACPGLPNIPASEGMDIDKDGNITPDYHKAYASSLSQSVEFASGLDHPECVAVHPDGSVSAGGEAGQI